MVDRWVGKHVRVKGKGNTIWVVKHYSCDEESWFLHLHAMKDEHATCVVFPSECTEVR